MDTSTQEIYLQKLQELVEDQDTIVIILDIKNLTV